MHCAKTVRASLLSSAIAVVALSHHRADAGGVEEITSRYHDVANRIIATAESSEFGFNRLTELCDTFGHRFSGSESLENAIDWILEELERDGLDDVRGEEVSVPKWVRGNESLQMLEPRSHTCPMLGLGGSVGTSSDGLIGEVLVVKSFEELQDNADRAKGKIVLFNAPFTAYRQTVKFRSNGAIEAAKVGAIASLVRSVGPFSMQTPHTGGMNYSSNIPKIPHAAITLEDAQMFQRMQDRGERIRVRLHMDAETLPNAKSRNVVADLHGRETPEEIVIVSGHIDSWDVGQGAMDDGGGCLAAWEAVRLLKTLDLRPRRTIRIVLWTNEENGMGGVKRYRTDHESELDDHILAIESDNGVFQPKGFSFTGSERAMPYFEQIVKLLAPIEATAMSWGSTGTDVRQLIPAGVPIMGLDVDRTKYFWYHHTEADTIDKLDLKEFNRCVAAFAVMAFIVADMPDRLPR